MNEPTSVRLGGENLQSFSDFQILEVGSIENRDNFGFKDLWFFST